MEKIFGSMMRESTIVMYTFLDVWGIENHDKVQNQELKLPFVSDPFNFPDQLKQTTIKPTIDWLQLMQMSMCLVSLPNKTVGDEIKYQ